MDALFVNERTGKEMDWEKNVALDKVGQEPENSGSSLFNSRIDFKNADRPNLLNDTSSQKSRINNVAIKSETSNNFSDPSRALHTDAVIAKLNSSKPVPRGKDPADADTKNDNPPVNQTGGSELIRDSPANLNNINNVSSSLSPKPGSSRAGASEMVVPVKKSERCALNPPEGKISDEEAGPELVGVITESRHEAQRVKVCPHCGLKIDAPETKMIPQQKVWFIFMGLFICLCWWISWLPFLCSKWYTPVEICPHCYRRTDRPRITSESNASHQH